MKIDKIVTDDDLIDFLLDQHKQTNNPNFLAAAHAIERYRRAHEIFSWKLSEHEWISVEDRLPEKDGRYLVAMKDGDKYHISTRRFKRTDPPIWWKGHVYGYWAKQTCGVRFWMPLPEPPKE